MTNEQKQATILAAIAERGWFTLEIYADAANLLRDKGLIKLGRRHFQFGNTKLVWVAA